MSSEQRRMASKRPQQASVVIALHREQEWDHSSAPHGLSQRDGRAQPPA
eukprot:CAMPEP_0179877050 /NCGR_PEP_ID=MMETSP0982-20121206/24592_1 /TAXON_ID=483367 /ORGANISM="non described non described, Strain CCMP 2436" /LENGTH=48 /DNA_ID= /DNA_START= /DNA_END= /DNA_ORIENTATION=